MVHTNVKKLKHGFATESGSGFFHDERPFHRGRQSFKCRENATEITISLGLHHFLSRIEVDTQSVGLNRVEQTSHGVGDRFEQVAFRPDSRPEKTVGATVAHLVGMR